MGKPLLSRIVLSKGEAEVYEFEEEAEDEYEPPVPKRRATVGHDVSYDDKKTEALPKPKRIRKRRKSMVPYFLLGVCIVFACYLLWSLVLVPWYTSISDQWHYGDAKVFLTGADVGHGGYSRFLADDNQGDIIVVEVVNKKFTVYTASTLYGETGKQRIVTVEVKDVNNDGKPDLVVNVEGMSMPIVLLNTGSAFSWSGK
jgi:hypothetical protein